MRSLVPIVASLTLAACATSEFNATGKSLVADHKVRLATAPNCCESYSDFRYLPLVIGQSRRVLVTPNSPVFAFPTGRSFFEAFELPPKGTNSLVIQVHGVNMLLNRYGHALVPGVLFLDERYTVLRLVNPQLTSTAFPFLGSWGQADVAVPTGARYVVIYDSQRGEPLVLRDSDQRSGVLIVAPGPTGDIRLELKGK